MRFSGSFLGRVLLAALASALLMSIAASPARASIGALVPAYFYPGTGGVNDIGDGWAEMASAAHTISVTAIFNPDSGPVPGPDPNPDYVHAITTLETAGGHVVAYVPTTFGVRPLSAVEADIQTYLTQYGGLIGGFFIDEMTSGASGLSYYHSLYQYIKGVDPSLEVIGNPGTIPDSGYLASATRSADTLVTFENYASNYPAYTPPSWAFDYPPSAFGNILHTQSSEAGMLADVALAGESRGLLLRHGPDSSEPLRPPSLVLGPGSTALSLNTPEPCQPGPGTAAVVGARSRL